MDFIGGDSLPAELQELAELLASGNTVLAAGAAARLDPLTRDQAHLIAEVLFDRVRERSDLTQQPAEFKTVGNLSNKRPELQVRFVRFFETMPVAQLGPWAATRLIAIARDTSVRPAADALLQQWQQRDNAALAAAAKSAKAM